MLPLADGFTLILTDLFDVSKTYSWEEFLKLEVIFFVPNFLGHKFTRLALSKAGLPDSLYARREPLRGS